MLSGEVVYADILQHETVFNKKMAGENPTIPVIITLKRLSEEHDSNCICIE